MSYGFAMPGVHFTVLLPQTEIDDLAEQAMDQTAATLAERAFSPRDDLPEDEARALAQIHALVYLQRSADRLAERLAANATRAGAGYPDLAAVLEMTRQGARRRFPDLIHRPGTPGHSRPDNEVS